MIDPVLFLIAGAFLLAGFVKGVIGLGLPTVSMGLLATVMTPAQALAIVVIPAIATNIWQTFAGPYLRDIVRRLWPLLIGTVFGTWLGSGFMVEPYARYGTITLGVMLIIYVAYSFRRIVFYVSQKHERWVGGIVGIITGLIAAATGVQVLPSMPYMQAIGMDKDELVQALGLYFTVSVFALAFNLSAVGLFTAATALPGIIAMVAAFAGMFTGQALRARMKPETFRIWFLCWLLLLGLYLAISGILKTLA